MNLSVRVDTFVGIEVKMNGQSSEEEVLDENVFHIVDQNDEVYRSAAATALSKYKF